ncbi:lasso peptide biosynthesis B2 protein [Streptomyces griseorubiginosus]|uniref:lasso peptide biosynthesis B2 protein n=1 Tax=Streptomyces griseorubiginosus TaxID=67304 RepID=UPI00362CAEF3
MTTPAVAEQAPRLPWHRQFAPRCAAGAARLLVQLPPARLHRVLGVLSKGSRPAGYAEVARARRAVVSVSTRCAGLGCLQRSVATALLCRTRGRWADWCTGFRTQPFGAHAWVEVGGRPVDEPGELSAFRTVLAVRRPSERARSSGDSPGASGENPGAPGENPGASGRSPGRIDGSR